MSEKELSDALYSMTGIKKGLFESCGQHIYRCYEAMTFKITAVKKGTFESLDRYIVRALKDYATKANFFEKKFLESSRSYENRCFQYLENLYSTNDPQDLLIRIYYNGSSWKPYSERAHAKANSRFKTMEVTYQGRTRVVELIYAGHIRNGDVVRGHIDNYDRYKFSKVYVSEQYMYDGDVYVDIQFENGECDRTPITHMFQRIIV